MGLMIGQAASQAASQAVLAGDAGEAAPVWLLIVGFMTLVVIVARVTHARQWADVLKLSIPFDAPRDALAVNRPRADEHPHVDAPAESRDDRTAPCTHASPDRPGFSLADAVVPFIWLYVAAEALGWVRAYLQIAPQGAFEVYAGAIIQVTSIAVMVLLISRATGGDWRGWGLRGDRPLRDPAWAVVTYLAAYPVIFAAHVLTQLVIAPGDHNTLVFLRDAPPGDPAVAFALVGAAVLAPMMEEFYYRGILLNLFAGASRSAWVGVAASALVFGLSHINTPDTVPPLIVFGAILGYVYVRTRSLTASILLHALFNVVTLAFLLIGGAPA